ncbi:MAG: hypothetical protein A2539_07210 [Elusimicrobia bacterium RIFOXYD2_FULL_34_15]|nr:MAG: hypothetical protein A2539_07210 [Elusimicrobia bacterium RIFOXYD2_FULL_34_15]
MKKFWRFLVILIIIIGITLYLRQQPENFSTLSNQIDIQCNKILTSFGIGDENVIQYLRIERKSKTVKWIEIVKQIKTDKNINDIIREIRIGLAEYGLNTNFNDKNNSFLISKDGIVLNKIFFLKYKKKTSKLKAAIIIIDDIGYKKDELSDFLSLGIPLTYSILPGEQYSSFFAKDLTRLNQEFFMHQPMEPENFPKVNPGKAAILLNMSKDNIEKHVLKNLKSVDGASGINNHMGSAFTQNKQQMETFLQIVKQKGIIFVDSHTSSATVAYKTALSMHIPSLQNEVFIDGEDDVDYMLKQLRFLKILIKKYGSGIAIGHVNRKNLVKALAEIIPEFQKENISFLTVSQYLESIKK